MSSLEGNFALREMNSQLAKRKGSGRLNIAMGTCLFSEMWDRGLITIQPFERPRAASPPSRLPAYGREYFSFPDPNLGRYEFAIAKGALSPDRQVTAHHDNNLLQQSVTLGAVEKPS